MHLQALLRDKQMAVPAAFPLRWQCYRPDGKLYKEAAGTIDEFGACGWKMETDPLDSTGIYRVDLTLPDKETVLGSTTFRMEAFVPDRMKVAFQAPLEVLRPGADCTVGLVGTHLFGGPAAERKATLRGQYVETTFA
ncbi:hypothetical protein BVY04_05015, partial [bacterium M21]